MKRVARETLAMVRKQMIRGLKLMIIMKKIFRFMMAALAASAAMTSCQQENLEPEVQGTVQVSVTISGQTKGFTDLEGIRWEVGDQIKYAGGVELTSEPLTAEQISEDGYTASFTFASILNEVDRTGWFCSTKCHPGNYNEVEFTLGSSSGNIYTQDVAGEMNSRYLFLHSGTGIVSIKAGEAPVIAMDVVGTIFRIIPYTSAYNDESVESVRLTSNTKLVGTVAYDRGAGTYKGVNVINWQSFPTLEVMLGTPMSLEGVTAADNSKGIYMAVAATREGEELQGYKYTVKTNKATYTFDAMDKALAVEENVVKNVLLDLDKATTRVDASSVIGQLQYVGELPAEFKVSYAAGTYGISYWYAQVRDSENDQWETRENKGNTTQFYNKVKFSAIDDTTGAPADWCSVAYREGDTWWDVTVTDNTQPVKRSATVTATFENVDGYVLLDGMQTKTIRIIQDEYSTNNILTFFGGVGDQVVENKAYVGHDLGYCVIDVNGVHAEDWAGDSHNEFELYSNVEIVCREGAANGPVVDWVTVGYGKDAEGRFNSTHLLANIAENTGAERKALVCCTYTAPEGYQFSDGTTTHFKQFFITQKAGETAGGDGPGSDVEVQEGMSYTIFNNAADGSKGTGFGPGAGSTGDWYRFENITIDGKTYTPGDEIKNLVSDTELMGRLMEQAFSFGELTDDDVQVPGTDPLTTDPESFVTLEPWSDGGAAIYVRIVLTANDSGARRTFKIITRDADGKTMSTIVYFQNI